MIDNLRFIIPTIISQISNQVREPVIVYDTICNPYYKNGFVQGYTGTKDNLHINANGRGINITGSWHSLYSGSNHTDFTLKDIKDTYFQIEEWTSGDIKQAKLTRLETGVNLLAFQYNTMFEYRGIRYQPLIEGKTTYGVKLRMTEKSLKVYDKTLERRLNKRINIDKSLTRIELCQTTSREIKSHGISKPSDLTKIESMNALQKSITTIVKNTKMKNTMDLKNLNATELKIYMAMTSPDEIASKAYKHRKSTYKRDRKQFNLWTKLSSKDQQKTIIDQIESKFEVLKNS